MKALFKTSHFTTYNGNEENPIFSQEALDAAKRIPAQARLGMFQNHDPDNCPCCDILSKALKL